MSESRRSSDHTLLPIADHTPFRVRTLFLSTQITGKQVLHLTHMRGGVSGVIELPTMNRQWGKLQHAQYTHSKFCDDRKLSTQLKLVNSTHSISIIIYNNS